MHREDRIHREDLREDHHIRHQAARREDHRIHHQGARRGDRIHRGARRAGHRIHREAAVLHRQAEARSLQEVHIHQLHARGRSSSAHARMVQGEGKNYFRSARARNGPSSARMLARSRDVALDEETTEESPGKPFLGRVALVVLVWSTAVVPVALGLKQCTIARIFHQPCPGCGLTRAAHLMMDGHVVASLSIHPLLVPVLLAHVLLAAATIHATWLRGTPFYFYRTPLGRWSLRILGFVYIAAILLWIARFFGALDGPVPV